MGLLLVLPVSRGSSLSYNAHYIIGQEFKIEASFEPKENKEYGLFSEEMFDLEKLEDFRNETQDIAINYGVTLIIQFSSNVSTTYQYFSVCVSDGVINKTFNNWVLFSYFSPMELELDRIEFTNLSAVTITYKSDSLFDRFITIYGEASIIESDNCFDIIETKNSGVSELSAIVFSVVVFLVSNKTRRKTEE